MRNFFTILVMVLIANMVFAGTPTLDGTFDGTGTWGTPVATADETAGWASANAKKLYVTSDSTYLYLGAEISAASWQAWAFIINTTTGGGTSDSWSRNITYAHTDKPDFTLRGTFGGYAEIHSWNGSSWSGIGSSVSASEFSENEATFVEIRILRTTIGDTIGDVQFYITGDNNSHGSFDACPNDDNATGWSDGSTLSNYQTGVALPVELTSFTAKKQGNSTQLNWATSSEENNDFFTIEKSLDGQNFKAIGTKAGAGNSLEVREYSFIDENPANGVNYYRLKQTDFDGKFSYSDVVSVEFKTKIQATIYPNPTSEKLTIRTETQDVVNIRIFSVTGQMVYQNAQRIENQTEINLNELTPGNYFLMITNDATQKTIYSSNFIKE